MTKRSKIIIGASLGLLVGVPGVALAVGDGHDLPRTRAEVQSRVQERFAALDANHDGAVTQAEADAARAQHMQERAARRAERTQARFARLDTDHNGQLSPAEFAARPDRGPEARGGDEDRRGPRHGWGGGRRGHGGHGDGHRGGPDAGPDGGRDMFARADANRDGRLTLAEMTAPALARFDRIDANRDGTISREEMQAARRTMRDAPPPPAAPAAPAAPAN